METTSIQQESLVSTATDCESSDHDEDGSSSSSRDVSPLGIAGDERVQTQMATASIPNVSSSTGTQRILDPEVGNVPSKQPLTVSGKRSRNTTSNDNEVEHATE